MWDVDRILKFHRCDHPDPWSRTKRGKPSCGLTLLQCQLWTWHAWRSCSNGSLLQICYEKILCILGQFEHGFSSWFQGFQSFDFALRHACCTKWVRWDSGVWSLRFLHLFWVLGTELLQDWKVFQTQKVGWWSPYEWDLFQPTFRGLISYTWNPKQLFIHGCLVISNHFLYKDLVHHPIENNHL